MDSNTRLKERLENATIEEKEFRKPKHALIHNKMEMKAVHDQKIERASEEEQHFAHISDIISELQKDFDRVKIENETLHTTLQAKSFFF